MIENKPFKILSIDGGGIKGLFSAEILSGFENYYGNPISDYFDMICGTSTGGIIALALSIKTPASNIVDFYKNDGPIIFPYKHTLSQIYAVGKQILINSKYNNIDLQKSLEKVFGDKRMADANNQICIPAYNLNQARPTVFKSPFFECGKNLWVNDENLEMVDIALATSAAPTYFPIHSINDIYYVDGGIWANNPTLCGITEALKYFIDKAFEIDGKIIRYNSIQVLSISSVTQPGCWSTKRKKNRSAFLWLMGNRLIQCFMDGQSNNTDYLIETLSTSIKTRIEYKRITHNENSYEVLKNVSLDTASKSSLKDLSILGRETVRYYNSTKKSEVQIYFENFKTFKNK